MQLDPRLGRGGLKLGCAAGLRPGVELEQAPARRQRQRVGVVGRLGAGLVARRAEEGAAVGMQRAVLLLGDRRSRTEVVPVVLAIVAAGIELAVAVEARA